MSTTYIVTSAVLEQFKQKARKLKRASGLPHHQALEAVAKEAGFNHWHHVVDCAQVTDLTEKAYYGGLILAMDVKDAEGFRDPKKRFVEDPQAFAMCAADMLEAIKNSENEDGKPLTEFAADELKQIMEEDMMNYVFFRYTGLECPKDIDGVLELVADCSFWPPRYVWLKNEFLVT